MLAGKLEAKKHPLDLIRAVAAVPQTQLLIAGAGELEGALGFRGRHATAVARTDTNVARNRTVIAWANRRNPPSRPPQRRSCPLPRRAHRNSGFRQRRPQYPLRARRHGDAVEEGAVGVFAGAGLPSYLLGHLASNAELWAQVGHFPLMIANAGMWNAYTNW